MDLTIILTAVTGLILFLFGIENFSKEIQKVAGEKFRVWLGKSTSNRGSATVLGAGVTAIIQSSAATTIIAVGLVNGGIISFASSLGIIFGANIGTTVTAQLVAFKLTAFAPIFIIAGFFINLFGRRHKILGKGMFYFGLVFFSLNLISQAILPIKSDPVIIGYFASLSNVVIALAVGLVFTAIVQSSSVTTGIVVVLAADGLIGLQQSIPILLGANIGSTMITILSSLRLNLYAKRLAVAHLFFNIIGALVLLPFIGPFASMISSIGGSASQQVANAHTIFNILAAIVFLIFLKYYKRFIEKIVPGKEKEILMKTKYLQEELPEDNEAAIKLIERELGYSQYVTSQMFKKADYLLQKPSYKQIDRLKRYEELNDLLDKNIEKSLLHLSQRNLTESQSERLVLLVRISNLIEQLGDSADDLGSLCNSVNESGRTPSKESIEDLDEMVKIIRKNIKALEKFFPKHLIVAKVKRKSRLLKKTINKKYGEHFMRIKKRGNYSGSIFVEAISIIEQSFNKIDEIADLTEKYNEIDGKN
jgi:phosphate:Na+ symporter